MHGSVVVAFWQYYCDSGTDSDTADGPLKVSTITMLFHVMTCKTSTYLTYAASSLDCSSTLYSCFLSKVETRRCLLVSLVIA